MDNNNSRRTGVEAGFETVYGTSEDSTMVMSEKVSFFNS